MEKVLGMGLVIYKLLQHKIISMKIYSLMHAACINQCAFGAPKTYSRCSTRLSFFRFEGLRRRDSMANTPNEKLLSWEPRWHYETHVVFGMPYDWFLDLPWCLSNILLFTCFQIQTIVFNKRYWSSNYICTPCWWNPKSESGRRRSLTRNCAIMTSGSGNMPSIAKSNIGF